MTPSPSPPLGGHAGVRQESSIAEVELGDLITDMGSCYSSWRSWPAYAGEEATQRENAATRLDGTGAGWEWRRRRGRGFRVGRAGKLRLANGNGFESCFSLPSVEVGLWAESCSCVRRGLVMLP
jgi:hypothetical protein